MGHEIIYPLNSCPGCKTELPENVLVNVLVNGLYDCYGVIPRYPGSPDYFEGDIYCNGSFPAAVGVQFCAGGSDRAILTMLDWLIGYCLSIDVWYVNCGSFGAAHGDCEYGVSV